MWAQQEDSSFIFENQRPWCLFSFLFAHQSTMPSESPPPNTSHKVETISAQLQFHVQTSTKDTTKGKAKKPLGKLESKNKELTFNFELSEENYLSFLLALLKEHGYEKYTPIKKQHHFGIKVGIGAKKAYISDY